MELTRFKEKSAFIIFGAFAVILLTITFLGFALFSPRGTTEKTPRPTILPTPKATVSPNVIWPPRIKPEDLPADIKSIKEKIIAVQISNRGGDIILHQPGSYEIIYVPTLKAFFVPIYKDPAETHRKEAQDWFLKFGLKQADLCNLPVRFTLFDRQLKDTNPNFKYLPDGC